MEISWGFGNFYDAFMNPVKIHFLFLNYSALQIDKSISDSSDIKARTYLNTEIVAH